MAVPKRRKSINFDLDTERLRLVFGEAGRRNAYAQVKRFFEARGFEHRQWSGYVSIERMGYDEVYLLMDALLTGCPWMADCANRFDVTDFMAESDVLGYIVSKHEVADDADLAPEAL
jgi:virulence-associated protein VapD